MLRFKGVLPLTVTIQSSRPTQDMSDNGMATLQKPVVPFVPVTLKLSVLTVELKLKPEIEELLTVSTEYVWLFQAMLKLSKGAMSG